MSVMFTTGERVHLPWLSVTGQPIEGTITSVEPHRFRITWDRDPPLAGGARPPRVRRWYSTAAVRFVRGNYKDAT